jgi:hypothetical protein
MGRAVATMTQHQTRQSLERHRQERWVCGSQGSSLFGEDSFFRAEQEFMTAPRRPTFDVMVSGTNETFQQGTPL